ncbi:hypothetical protein, partial [Moritella viscosa]|uniref:hypothetical protein n=1 Tax=Moritella viscosa TaxID=80854 RepID=UPI003B42EC7A
MALLSLLVAADPFQSKIALAELSALLPLKLALLTINLAPLSPRTKIPPPRAVPEPPEPPAPPFVLPVLPPFPSLPPPLPPAPAGPPAPGSSPPKVSSSPPPP